MNTAPQARELALAQAVLSLGAILFFGSSMAAAYALATGEYGPLLVISVLLALATTAAGGVAWRRSNG